MAKSVKFQCVYWLVVVCIFLFYSLLFPVRIFIFPNFLSSFTTDPSNINTTRYDVYMQLDPAGTSVQNMNHWGQMIREDTFCYYRYLTRHENEQVTSYFISNFYSLT